MSRMFMGEYNHTIDAKGRIIVPSKFRNMLGDNFVVTNGLDGCLWVFPADEWDLFYEKLRSLPVTKKDTRQFVRNFMANADNPEIDKQGRILIPQNLRQKANLEKDVVLIGTGPRIEIWNKEAWEATYEEEDADEIAERMGDWGFDI